ncbi:MAG: DUF4193 family protein [Acidimicrobiales bacterium]
MPDEDLEEAVGEDEEPDGVLGPDLDELLEEEGGPGDDEALDEDELAGDDSDEDVEDVASVESVENDEGGGTPAARATVTEAPERGADEDEEEEEEEVDDDEVEASLDVILKERLVVAEDEEEEAPEGDERPESSGKVLPKQPGEFVCQSCFLVKHPSQLADPRAMLCRDCV